MTEAIEAGRALLERLLSRVPLGDADVEAFLERRVKEGQHHDYKSGSLFLKKAARDVIREYISAFASSDGGVLIVGVARDGTVDGCGSAKVGQLDLDDWAVRQVAAVAPDLGPLLSASMHTVKGKKILLVAVARAPRLVGVQVGQDFVQYLRMGEETLKAPSFLVNDLYLGRRERPYLTLRIEPEMQAENISAWRRGQGPAIMFFLLRLSNESFAHARNVRLALITFNEHDCGRADLSPLLQRHVNEQPPLEFPTLKRCHLPFSFSDRRNASHAPTTVDLPAMAESLGHVRQVISLGGLRDQREHEMRAAIYATVENGEPQWWQFRACFSRGQTLDSAALCMELEPMLVARPGVSYGIL